MRGDYGLRCILITAVGLNLPFGILLESGVILPALDVFLILWTQKLDFRWFEAFIVMLGVIAFCFDSDRHG